MRELLTTAVRVGGVTHLVGPVTMVLQGGPRYAYLANEKVVIVIWAFQNGTHNIRKLCVYLFLWHISLAV